MTTDPALQAEIIHRLAIGCERVSVAEMENRYRALGYALDRDLDCRCMSRIMTGPDAGRAYPCITTGVKEIDTRRSAFHFESRRDTNYRAMQRLRQDIFAVTKGAILEP
ncbi:hypothetical protein DEA98_10025 [Brucella pseudogrignonensis]|uniref:Uncharacterized protein n=2 Tax=Brucella TaxID=234 RepID=A0A5C5CRV2_9HYPH|nr:MULTISPECIES: hypothetical protein [Brucella]MBB4092436.1 hypothetical protein [Brucella pecoris]MCM0751535.1 hypothetical protein [Brucella pseudogrignonensis]NNV22069.1 hypothetical protein [Brucella pseudogrignonensis]TNV14282.1 hypothetical protein FIB18_03315 [Brucella pecoris]